MPAPIRTIDMRLTRRRLLGLLALGGGGLILAACGGSASTATTSSAPSSAAPATASNAPASIAPTAAASAQSPAASAATATRAVTATASAPSATRGAATASATSRATTPATATRGTTGEGALIRMLRQVPQRGVTLDRYGLSFADIETQKRTYGLDGLTSYTIFTSQPQEQFAKFNRAMSSLPIPDEISFQVAAGDKPNPLGYTFWQMERASSAGQPRTNWLRLEGRLDPAAIRAALTAAGRTPTTYGGATILTRGADNAIDINDPIASGTIVLSTFNRATIDDGALIAAPTTAAIEGSIDTRAGRAPSLADDPNMLAVATALGPVVSATVVPPDFIYRPPAPNTRGTAVATPATPATPRTSERLLPYRGFGVGMRDDGRTQTMVIALSYDRADDARAAGAIVRRRAEDYRLAHAGGVRPAGTPLPLLRDSAAPGDPQLVTVGASTVMVLPLAMAGDANLGLWRAMVTTSDFGFLTE